MKPIKLYKVEVGVLLPKDHDEFADYSQVYDKQHAYYDENTIFFTNKEMAIQYVKKYVKNGVVNTYGIVSELIYDPQEIYGDDYVEYLADDLKSIKENGYFENYVDIFCDDNWDIKNVVYNIYKPKDCSLATNIF